MWNQITDKKPQMRRYSIKLSLIHISIFLCMISCQKNLVLGPESKTDLATQAQEDCGYIQNEFGERVSWKSNLPIRLLLDSSIPGDMIPIISSASEKWEKASGKKLFEFQQSNQSTSLKPSSDKINSVYWSKDWSENHKSQQALTILTYLGPLITEADIKINAKDYEFYTTTPQNSVQVNFESLIIHELGHVLGLKHMSIKPTVMWPTLAAAFLRLEISPIDIKSLKCEY